MRITERIQQIGIIPVVSIPKLEHALPLAEALIEGGLACAEITFRTAAAAEAIAQIRSRFPEILLGAGTVLTTEQADTAINAGAEFIVSPGTNLTVVDHCLSKGVTIFPGVCTPTEVEMALSKGVDVLKFFPAEPMGGVKFCRRSARRTETFASFRPAGLIQKHRAISGLAASRGLWRKLDGQAGVVRGGRFREGKATGRRSGCARMRIAWK